MDSGQFRILKSLKIDFMVFTRVQVFLIVVLGSIIGLQPLKAQIDNNGCVGANYGIDAGLYSGVIEFGDGAPAAGTTDWFLGASGRGIINESQIDILTPLLQATGNPTYEVRMNSGLSSIVDGQILIDGLFARDRFGGTGYYDFSSFETASKNGEDPAIWDAGQSNVLGKNDLIDVAGHMFRDGENLAMGIPSDLWFVGLINRAEPGGTAYMDFEFLVEDVQFIATPTDADPGEGNFTSGGPQLGHTAFTFNATTGEITSVGDFLFNTALINGGIDADVELRLWVSYADYTTITPATFSWGLEYDGAFNGSPYGYASIIPLSEDACGIVNLEDQHPAAPPWGTKTTKTNTWGTSYDDYAIVEVGVNMTAFGLDHASLAGTDPCLFPIETFLVKTRASASFTAQLKDYAGPYQWGTPNNESVIDGDPLIACDNPEVFLNANPIRTDVTYSWTTADGSFASDPNLPEVYVDLPGTYVLHSILPTGCPIPDTEITVGLDPAKPFFNEPSATTTVSCNGNDGTIDLTITGATPPYSYEWFNENDLSTVISTDEDPTGLAGGNYVVIVTDQIPCNISSALFTVKERVPTIISFAPVDVDCIGENTGSVDVTVTGEGPFSYAWSNGSSLEDLNGLSAGNYTLTTTDADDCEEIASFSISEPSAISLTIISTTDETDPAADDGEIDLGVIGGTPDYTYLWSNDELTQDLTNLAAGVYTVTVTDNNGCTEVISATIYEPEVCDDGIDNDGDGLTDCFDGDCTPPDPGPITPSDDPVCVGDTDITYTIDPVVGATNYIWTVPEGATITSVQGATMITVDWVSNLGGEICVTADNVGCLSAGPSCYAVNLEDVPGTPGSINAINGN